MIQVAKSGEFDGLKDFKKPGTGVTPSPTTTTTTTTSSSSSYSEVHAQSYSSGGTAVGGTAVDIEVAPPPRKKGTIFGAVFGTLLLLVLIAGIGAFGWKCAFYSLILPFYQCLCVCV
jgi:hypothetical protein